MSIIDHPLDPVKVGSEHPESLIAKQSFFCYNMRQFQNISRQPINLNTAYTGEDAQWEKDK